jgi:SulP family sulfate permease
MLLSQVYVFLGVNRLEGVHSLYEQGVYLVTHLDLVQLPTVFIGIVSLLLLILLKRFSYATLAPLICFAISGCLVEILGLSSYSSQAGWLHSYLEQFHLLPVALVGDNGDVNMLLPHISFPFFNMRLMNGVLPVACAIALLSMMETISVAKSIAASSGQRLSVNQEIFGIGLGNLFSAFAGGMPISGSPSRSGLNYRSGAQTRYAAIFSGLCVVLTVTLLGFLLTRIPLTSLASLLLVTAGGLINRKHLLLCVKATNADAFVLWSTLLSCIFLSLDVAFYIGITLSILLYLKKAAVPQLVEYEIADSGELKPVNIASATAKQGIRVIKVEGELFFGAADLFQNTLKTFAEDDHKTRVIILQLKNARDIDATTCLALEQLYKYLKGSQRHLIACGLTPPIWEVLSSSGLVQLLGKENLFLFDQHHPQQHMQHAILHAKKLLEEEIPKEVTLSSPETELPIQQLEIQITENS